MEKHRICGINYFKFYVKIAVEKHRVCGINYFKFEIQSDVEKTHQNSISNSNLMCECCGKAFVGLFILNLMCKLMWKKHIKIQSLVLI